MQPWSGPQEKLCDKFVTEKRRLATARWCGGDIRRNGDWSAMGRYSESSSEAEIRLLGETLVLQTTMGNGNTDVDGPVRVRRPPNSLVSTNMCVKASLLETLTFKTSMLLYIYRRRHLRKLCYCLKLTQIFKRDWVVLRGVRIVAVNSLVRMFITKVACWMNYLTLQGLTDGTAITL